MIWQVTGDQADIYNSVEFNRCQLYFLATGKIMLFNGSTRLLECEERWLSKIDSHFSSDRSSKSPAIQNYSRGVALHGNYAYFIGPKGNVQRFDMPSLIRIADTKRSYRSESQPTGTVVDFCLTDKDRIVSVAEYGIITVVEGGRSIKQTGRLSETDCFTCVAWIEDKILVGSYSPGQRSNQFRLLGPDMRDLPGQVVEDTSSQA